jgi:hypothetical protein
LYLTWHLICQLLVATCNFFLSAAFLWPATSKKGQLSSMKINKETCYYLVHFFLCFRYLINIKLAGTHPYSVEFYYSVMSSKFYQPRSQSSFLLKSKDRISGRLKITSHEMSLTHYKVSHFLQKCSNQENATGNGTMVAHPILFRFLFCAVGNPIIVLLSKQM